MPSFEIIFPPDPPPDDDTPPDYIVPGIYPVQIRSWERRESTQRKGYFYIAWEFSIEDRGIHPKFRVYLYTPFEGHGLWKTQELVKAVTDEKPEGKYTLDPDSFVGKRIAAKLRVDTYQSRHHSSIVWIKSRKEAEGKWRST